jgi:hypothetical protein
MRLAGVHIKLTEEEKKYIDEVYEPLPVVSEGLNSVGFRLSASFS